ncbi:MAG: hypothetical protein KAI79_18570 [Bacteroidales bacterium]|nr:hypothetical protein [Bacteroidales bacterium]
MRKENRIVYTYLQSLEKGIKKLKNDIKSCPKEDIESIFLDALDNDHTEKLANRMQDFFDKLRK